MPMRYAQRKHIIQSLNSLLYQLHTVSFLLSPRLWAFFCRVLAQFQFARPRDIDSQRSLRFWFFCILCTNVPSLFNHIFKETDAGRSIVLDFVGVDAVPSRALLLFLDFVIILLEFILTTIAFETSLSRDSPPDTPDPLQPQAIPSTPVSPLPFDEADVKPPELPLHEDGTEYIIDLRLRTLLHRLRHPPPLPPPPRTRLSEDLLPLPSTTSFELNQSLRMLSRITERNRDRAAGRAARGRQGNASTGRSTRGSNRSEEGTSEEARRLPGGMESVDEG
ncbi:hypothetical protein PYCCODRAFT_1456625 [Trametes coccinea BRFM310]|uniref:DUF1746 domain-containing protein n=1 Tax=Trametes coccinea (strain BRFM310) TaxID=1353009 RepID=A0A1Y2J0Z5_TRAC3|nr:hypothetical protein PYCCODRAFT_1456625 [Trametes coccinea BRFM310]